MIVGSGNLTNVQFLILNAYPRGTLWARTSSRMKIGKWELTIGQMSLILGVISIDIPFFGAILV